MVEDFLSQQKIDYTKRDVSADPCAARELINRTGKMGVPVTIINDQTIVGFDQVKLKKALNQKQKISFGVSITDASKITTQQGIGTVFGAYIGSVKPDSTAQRTGLKPHDIITELNMQNIANASDFEIAISKLRQGGRFSIVFLRGNKKFSNEGIFKQ
ncbi:MAG: PDZ domain-containing protein [Dehalococcoidia bacterium]|nr:MAG: PDZ domain-containing protein [Dehalococcoidia bacterium]